MNKIIDLKKAKSNRRRSTLNGTSKRQGASSGKNLNGSGLPRNASNSRTNTKQISVFHGPIRDRIGAMLQIVVALALVFWFMQTCSM